MREWLHKLISALAVVALAFGVTTLTPGCEYEDDDTEEVLEEPVEEGGEALEEGGEALEEGAGEVGEEL